MLIERLNILLPYQVRRLTEEDGDEIFALQRRHPEYHALFLNHKAKKADVLSDLTSIPEGVLPENKFYLGMYDADKLVAIADVVLNFPTSKTAWLGLIMVDYDVVVQGIGGKIIEMLKRALMREQFEQLCTIVPTESDVGSFFDAHGFSTGEEMPMGVREDGCEIVGKLRTVDLNVIK